MIRHIASEYGCFSLKATLHLRVNRKIKKGKQRKSAYNEDKSTLFSDYDLSQLLLLVLLLLFVLFCFILFLLLFLYLVLS